MRTRVSAPRLLGATFLVVVLTSLISGVLLSSAVGSGSYSNLLAHLADNVFLMRLSILAGLANTVGVVILAALLFVVLEGQSRIVALVALGLWLSEAVLYALLYKSRYLPSVIPAYGLAAVSVGLVGVAWQVLGNAVPIVVYLAILPFELTIGTWLLLKGIRTGSEATTEQPLAWSPRATAGGTR
jgi:hypothetical protein